MIPTSTLLNRWRSILLVLAASLLVAAAPRTVILRGSVVGITDGDTCTLLVGADLGGAYLTNANLHSANMVYADLTGADLTFYADLTDANLGADLQSADLRYANLSGANLTDSNLTPRVSQFHYHDTSARLLLHRQRAELAL